MVFFLTKCLICFFDRDVFPAEMLNWYSSQYKLTKFWLLIFVRKIHILAKKMVPRIFHQTPCFPHPAFSTPHVFHTPRFPHPGTLYPATPAPHFPPSQQTTEPEVTVKFIRVSFAHALKGADKTWTPSSGPHSGPSSGPPFGSPSGSPSGPLKKYII